MIREVLNAHELPKCEIMQLMDDERQAIGHEFSNMIKACTYKQRDCLNSR